MSADNAPFALFDCDDGGAIVLSAYRRTISLVADDRQSLFTTFADIERAGGQGEWVAIAADYALGRCFEKVPARSPGGSPLLLALVFGEMQRLDALALDAYLAERIAGLPAWQQVAGVAELAPTLDAAAHAAKVEQIRRWIADGDCYQINLTFPQRFQLYGHPLALYARLRKRQPVRYGGFVAMPDDALFSSPISALLSFSPELFFERRACRVITRPMKGTAARDDDPQRDLAQRDALLASDKERAENVMIVDLLRNDLGRLAAPGDVRVEALCAVETYPTVWQMVSTVTADLPDVSLHDLFRALFPCGSITGAPKIRAMGRIAELESAPRGFYTGAFGWLAPDGDCRFNVAIRTLEVGADGAGKLGIGSGIVIDADPAREYAECLLKSRFVSAYDPGFELIETLRLEDGRFPLLALHLERIAASARSLGFAINAAEIESALGDCAQRHELGQWRVRLTLAHDGRYRIVPENFAETAPGQVLKVVLAETRLNRRNYLLRHKTTARAHYDRVLATLADQPEVFDAIFFNGDGEVCEGARSNVFIACGEKLLTPPLTCGLLPGVMRRHLLESGQAIECVLHREDLLGASQIYVANALRGLVPVTLLT